MRPSKASLFTAFLLATLAGCSVDAGDSTADPSAAAAVTAAHPSIQGNWGRSGMAEGPDGPVSITLDATNKFTSTNREDQVDVERNGTWRRVFGDASSVSDYVGDGGPPAWFTSGGDFLLLGYDGDQADLYAVGFDKSRSHVVLNLVGKARGQGMHVDGTKGPDVFLTKDFDNN